MAEIGNVTVRVDAVITDEQYREAMGAVRAANERMDLLEVKNRKLLELCADMWRFTGTACKKYPRLFDPAAQGPQTVQLNMIDAFEQRMRELGIEV